MSIQRKKNPMEGRRHSEESKRKMSEAKKGKRHTEEHNRKIAEGSKGRKHSEETKKKMGDSKKGRKRKPFSEEWKRRIGEANRGRHHSEESKKKIGDGNRGRTDVSGKDNPMWGKHHSEETKKKWSDARNGTQVMEKNHNWRGGLSFEPYSLDFDKELRRKVRRRDRHICQLCFRHGLERGVKLVVHHIDYDKKHSSMDNLITLCSRCHGLTNGSRKVWIAFFGEKIDELSSLKMLENFSNA